LTLLGAAGEACGLDRLMKTNTSKKRTMSGHQGFGWLSDEGGRRAAGWPGKRIVGQEGAAVPSVRA